MDRNNPIAAHLALFIVGAIYAGNYVVAKGIMPDVVGPSGFIVLRVVGGSAMFLLTMALTGFFNRDHRIFEKIDRQDWWRFIASGLSGVAINQLCFFNGLSLTSPINASLIMTINPIFVLLVSYVLLGSIITKRKLIGIFIGGVGAAMLLVYSAENTVSDNLSGSSMMGDTLILINALSYGVYLVVVKPLMQKYRPLTVITWVFIIGTVFVIPVGWNQATQIMWSELTPSHIRSISYVILGTTFLAYLLNIIALKRVAPVVVSIYIYLQPLLVLVLVGVLALLGVSEYHKDINLMTGVCAVAIFTGVWLVSVPRDWKLMRGKS
ncbi:MAG: DMT family transporter [Flavobacteriales bacterium]|nr:DMT family transporter [Flavobacteriales bacterium]